MENDLTKTFKISVETNPSDSDLDILSDGVISFGRKEAGVGEPDKLACFIRDNAKVIAGVSGRIEFKRLFVEFLWTEESKRNQGYGTALLRKIETEALHKGCIDLLIETLSDDNADFYKRLGYKEKAIVENHIPGFTRHILIKVLNIKAELRNR